MFQGARKSGKKALRLVRGDGTPPRFVRHAVWVSRDPACSGDATRAVRARGVTGRGKLSVTQTTARGTGCAELFRDGYIDVDQFTLVKDG